MSSLKTLLKYSLINRLNINKILQKVKKKNIVLIVLALILTTLVTFLFSTAYMYIMGTTLVEVGCVDLLILMGLAFGSMMCFVSNIPMCESMIFHSRDFEMLSSMPIKTKDIVISKFLTLIIINYGVIGLLLFSSTLVVLILGSLTLPMFLLILVVFIFAPLIPIALSGACSFVFSKITSRLKHKNIISLILTIAFVILVMFISMSLKNVETSPSDVARDIMIKMFKNMSYPSYLGFLAINGDFISLILLISLSLVVIFLFFYVVSKNYNKINSDMNVHYQNKKFSIDKIKSKPKKEKSLFTSFFKLEIKKYFSLSGYVLNTIIGPLMGTIMIIVLMSQGLDISIIALGGDSYLALVVVALVTLFSNITPTTASTISLEGENLWILKSLPVNAKTILQAKAMVSLVTNIPFSIINGLLTYFIWNVSLVDLMFIIIIPSLFTIFMTYASLYVNLLLPRFDWDNPIKIVKNSASVLVSMAVSAVVYFISLIIVVVLMVLEAYVYVILLVLTLLVLALMVVAIVLVNTKGVKLFNNLVG